MQTVEADVVPAVVVIKQAARRDHALFLVRRRYPGVQEHNHVHRVETTNA